MQSRITKKKATYILGRMYTLLRARDFKFLFDKDLDKFNAHAMADLSVDDQYRLDPGMRVEGGIIALAFHELLHELYIDLSEQEVNALEKKMIRLLSARQLKNFLKRIADLM